MRLSFRRQLAVCSPVKLRLLYCVQNLGYVREAAKIKTTIGVSTDGAGAADNPSSQRAGPSFVVGGSNTFLLGVS